MTLPINSLANMEYMLYGGALGANPNCPSYANGYKAVNNNYYNPYMQQYQNELHMYLLPILVLIRRLYRIVIIIHLSLDKDIRNRQFLKMTLIPLPSFMKMQTLMFKNGAT